MLECWLDGTIIFLADLDSFLCWGTKAGRINPLALGESTYTFVELARRVYDHADPRPKEIEFILALYGLDTGGAKHALTPYGIKSIAFTMGLDAKQPPMPYEEVRQRVSGAWTA